jgi:hypothetical protein
VPVAVGPWQQLVPVVFTACTTLGWGLAGSLAGALAEAIYPRSFSQPPNPLAETLASLVLWVGMHTLGALAVCVALVVWRRSMAWHAPWVVAGWAAIAGVGWGLGQLVARLGSSGVGLVLAVLWGGLAGGALFAAAALGWRNLIVQRRAVAGIQAGWLLGLLAAMLADGSQVAELFGFFGVTALTGLIGGGLMFAQLSKLPPSSR